MVLKKGGKVMIQFLKVFLITFLASMLLIFGGIYSYIMIFNPLDDIVYGSADPDFGKDENNGDSTTSDNKTPFEKALEEKNIINVLVVGFEASRTDTIMVASFDRDTKEADLISIPRDTYYEREGYYDGFLRINAVYQSEDIDGLIDAVENILNIPIHRYVTVDYEAVVAGVDILGGVEVYVPMHMYYEDPYATPPLHIDIPEGYQLLDGENSLDFLRFRSGYPDADLGRIKAQQEFLKAALSKVLTLKLPSFIQEVYGYVETNFSISELIALASDAVGFTMDKLETRTLPGTDKTINGVSFFLQDEEETLILMYDMYGVTTSNKLEE